MKKETRTKIIWQKAELLWLVHLTIRFCSLGGSSNLQLHVLAGRWTLRSALLLWVTVRDPYLAQFVIPPHKCTCQIASKSIQRFEQESQMWQTDRQTDHTTEKCVGIGEIAGAARAIPGKNACMHYQSSAYRILDL